MIGNDTISLIIPAFNEEKHLERTLKSLSFDWIDELIIVNDGSTDRTPNIARKYSRDVIDLPENMGKGEAVSAGVQKCKGSIIVIIDADLGESVMEIKKLVDPLINDNYKAVVAVLPIKGGGLGIVRGLANMGMKVLTGKKMRAPLSGQRAFRREIINNILPLQSGFGLEIGINRAFIDNNIDFCEVDCNFHHRITGQDISGYRHRIKQFKEILKAIIKMKRHKNNV
ncbi:MAG: glycosyltransferase family 2 protein [Halanaerobiaceae bacterium]